MGAENEKDNPSFAERVIRYTLVGRSVFQFQSYLYNPSLEPHFKSHDYLYGLASEKKEAFARMTPIMGRMLIITFLLVCYLIGIRFEFQLLGTQVLQFPALIEVLSFMTAMALLATIISFLDYLKITRVLDVLAENVFGLDSPIYGYAHKNAHGLWGDIFALRSVGYVSSNSHKAILTAFGLYLFAYAFFVIAIPFGAVLYTFYFIVIDCNHTSWFFTTLVCFSLVVSIVSISLFIVALCVKFNFEIPEAEY